VSSGHCSCSPESSAHRSCSTKLSAHRSCPLASSAHLLLIVRSPVSSAHRSCSTKSSARRSCSPVSLRSSVSSAHRSCLSVSSAHLLVLTRIVCSSSVHPYCLLIVHSPVLSAHRPCSSQSLGTDDSERIKSLQQQIEVKWWCCSVASETSRGGVEACEEIMRFEGCFSVEKSWEGSEEGV
jgi:hypothetical protein